MFQNLPLCSPSMVCLMVRIIRIWLQTTVFHDEQYLLSLHMQQYFLSEGKKRRKNYGKEKK